MNFDKFMSFLLIVFGIFLIQLPMVAVLSYGSSCQAKKSPSYTAAIFFENERVEVEVKDYDVLDTFLRIEDVNGNVYIVGNENVIMKGR